MFSQFLTVATCVAMLWHSIGGCCWHHDHPDCDEATAGNSSGTMHHPPGMRPHSHFHHEHHSHDQTSDDEPLSPTPCDPSQHCTGETCVYVKSFSPDLTDLFVSQDTFATPASDVLELHAFATLPTTDRVAPHREELSARHRCALIQAWLL